MEKQPRECEGEAASEEEIKPETGGFVGVKCNVQKTGE